jgi:hemerythrin-like domain-containing protein
MPNARAGMVEYAFPTRGTALALPEHSDGTNAAPAASHSHVSGGHSMPSRRNDQEHPADAIAMLKADHQRVKDLFAQYEATSNPDTKRTLADQVFVELETHAQLEENVFYPAVNEDTDEGLELVKESLSEHETVKTLIQALRSLAQDTEAFDAKFQELIHNVEHHVEEEESEMFPLAEQALAEDLEELSEEMQELKAELQGS